MKSVPYWLYLAGSIAMLNGWPDPAAMLFMSGSMTALALLWEESP